MLDTMREYIKARELAGLCDAVALDSYLGMMNDMMPLTFWALNNHDNKVLNNVAAVESIELWITFNGMKDPLALQDSKTLMSLRRVQLKRLCDLIIG